MSMASFAGLLEEFGRSIGLSGVAPDTDGYCAMSFDDVVVHFQYDDNDLSIFSSVGEVDEGHIAGIYTVLLAANLFWQGTKGATISVEPDSRMVFIADRKPVAHLNDSGFQNWLGEFVSIAEYWSKSLANANAEGPPRTDDATAAAPSDPDTVHMTRV